jgi:hypothetical protein
MSSQNYRPAEDAELHRALARGKPMLDALNVIRKAKGLPSYSEDLDSLARWRNAGEPISLQIASVIKRLIKDGGVR